MLASVRSVSLNVRDQVPNPYTAKVKQSLYMPGQALTVSGG